MGTGGCKVELSASKSSVRKPPTGLQILRTGGCIKPRIIHTYSPKVYKIKPEEFLDLVQKLTGRPAAQSQDDDQACNMMSDMSPTSCNTTTSLSPISTYQFFGNESAKSERLVSDEDSSMSSPPADYKHEHCQILKPTSEAVGTLVSSQLLASLHKPKFVTLDLFQKFSSNHIPSFNQSRREGSFTSPSTAY